MISILSRIFIKNHTETSDPGVRRAYGVLCGAVGIFLNVLLFAAKYLAGTLTGSIAIVADAFNNLSDAGSSIITLLAVAALARLSPIRSMVACTYQAVSGAGAAGLQELEQQLADRAAGRELHRSVFPAQIACNVIPFIGRELPNGYTDEEMKMQN